VPTTRTAAYREHDRISSIETEKGAEMTTQGKIAVAGATGRVGRHIVDVLEEQERNVVAISRSTDIDVVTGEGLAEALSGVESVVDASSGASPEQQDATDFFTAAARNLQEFGAQAGVHRIIVVSIIGTDRFTAGYGAAKQAHERAMLAGPIPATIVRAAQFHEFVSQLMDWGRQDGAIYLPKMRTQLVAARTVAEMLADLATGCGPAPVRGSNGAPILEIAGPREESLVEMARLLAAHRGEAVRIEAVTNPDDPDGALYESGALLPGPHAILAGPSFEEWLRAQTDEKA
jgi:uncharacterized protein YbjT (DUF2867 family)